MKYIKYIVGGRPIRPEQLGVIALPAAAVGVVALCGLLPGALLRDGGRYIKLRLILHKREQSKIRYIRSVLRSLDVVPTNQLINLLTAA